MADAGAPSDTVAPRASSHLAHARPHHAHVKTTAPTDQSTAVTDDETTAEDDDEMDAEQEQEHHEEVVAHDASVEYTGPLQHQPRRGSYRLSHEEGAMAVAANIVASMMDEDGDDFDDDEHEAPTLLPQ